MTRIKICIIVISFFFVNGKIFAQSIPNGGFETWINNGSYSNPQSWDTPNAESTAIPIFGTATVFRETSNPHSGAASAKLQTKSILGFNVPGVLTLGQLNVNILQMDFSLTGGAPYSLRPDVFRGYYRYTPQGGDTCAIMALFYKNNAGNADTIGAAFFFDTATVSQWTQFEAPIDWFSADFPDTVNIIAISSASYSGSANTALYLDDLSFDYFTGITPPNQNEKVGIVYDPENGKLIVDFNFEDSEVVEIQLFNLLGQPAFLQSMGSMALGHAELDLTSLAKGIYVAGFKHGRKDFRSKIFKF